MLFLRVVTGGGTGWQFTTLEKLALVAKIISWRVVCTSESTAYGVSSDGKCDSLQAASRAGVAQAVSGRLRGYALGLGFQSLELGLRPRLGVL